MSKQKSTHKHVEIDGDFGCTMRELPADVILAAAKTATEINPANAPDRTGLLKVLKEMNPDADIEPQHLALVTAKYWGTGGVKLGVSFMDSPAADLRDRIISHMNAWATQENGRKGSNVSFAWSQSQGQVRISRGPGGYYSYLGTDILHIAQGQQTMNLEKFTMQTPESEYRRVVRHETGHTLGFPHEQQLPEIVALLDVQKTIAWGAQALGWDESTVRSQILTPINPNSIRMTAHADKNGIMCYMLPASITKNGQPIPGGTDIDSIDDDFASSLYPREVVQPPTPPPPPPPPVKPPNPNPGGPMHHQFTFDMADVQVILSTSSGVGDRLNSAIWLAGYAAQVTIPAAMPGPTPQLTDGENELKRLLTAKGTPGESAIFSNVNWGSILAWLVKLISGLSSGTSTATVAP